MTTILKYAHMASEAYESNPSVGGWTKMLDHYEPRSGLRSVVFYSGGTMVVSFRGTDNASDVVDDLQLGTGMNTAMYPVGQTIAAAASRHGTVVLTGHSLGGAVAQVVGNRGNHPFVTFNAPGVALLASRNIGSATPVMSSIRWVGGAMDALVNPGQAAADAASMFTVVQGKNFRLINDVVSAIGVHYGDVITLPTTAVSPLDAHSISTVRGVLAAVASGNTHFPPVGTAAASR